MMKKITVSLVVAALFTVLIVPAVTHADFASFWARWSGVEGTSPLIDAPIEVTDELVEQILLAAPQFRSERHLLPEASSTYDIGSSTREWRHAYIDNITATNTTTTVLDATTATIGTLTVSSLQNCPGITGSTSGTATTTANCDGTFHVGSSTDAAPGLALTGDTDTGVHFTGDNILGLNTGGSRRMTVDASGNVGIGTTTPQSLLHVSGGAIRLTDGQPINWDGNNILLHDGTATNIGDGSASAVVTLTGGNVGIGTTTPNAELTIGDGTDDFSFDISTDTLTIETVTVDGADDQRILVDAGGGAGNIARGAVMVLYGNEHASDGDVLFQMGETGEFQLLKGATGERAFVMDKDGNVGIGNSAPTSSLHIGTGDIGLSWVFDGATEDGISIGSGFTAGRMHIEGSESADLILYDSGGTSNERIISVVHSGGSTRFESLNDSGTGNSEFIRFEHNTDDLILNKDGNGNVGIGTASPTQQLDVRGHITVGGTARNAFIVEVTSSGGSPVYSFDGDTDTGLGSAAANNLSLTTAGSERVRIDGNGNVGIGTSTPNQILQVYRGSDGVVARFEDTDGTCDVNPTATALVCSSDRRMKKNITPLGTTLHALMQLEPVRFSWNREEGLVPTHIGLIAQEVEPYFPELVHEEGEHKSLSYSGFVPILIQAIQEQEERIQALEAKLERRNQYQCTP